MTLAASHIQVTNSPMLKVMLILEYYCNMEISFSISSLTGALLPGSNIETCIFCEAAVNMFCGKSYIDKVNNNKKQM